MRFLLVVLLGVCATAAMVVFLSGLSGPALLGSVRDLLAAQRKSARYQRELRVLRRLNEDKEQVVAALAGGRLTLIEAAHQFRQLHDGAGFPKYPDAGLRCLGEEDWCVQVLTFVRGAPAPTADHTRLWQSLHESFRRVFGHPPRLAGEEDLAPQPHSHETLG